jgi:hypothetical protein
MENPLKAFQFSSSLAKFRSENQKIEELKIHLKTFEEKEEKEEKVDEKFEKFPRTTNGKSIYSESLSQKFCVLLFSTISRDKRVKRKCLFTKSLEIEK